jgi:hypothetical protein
MFVVQVRSCEHLALAGRLRSMSGAFVGSASWSSYRLSSRRSAWLATRLDGILPECVGSRLAAQLLIADAGHQAVLTLIWRGIQ